MELENKKNGSGAAHTLKQMDLSKTETDIAETDQKPHGNELLLGTRESIKFVFAKFACSRRHSTVQFEYSKQGFAKHCRLSRW